jgi:hypothetical protein
VLFFSGSEASGNLAFEVVELGRLQSTWVALIFQSRKRLQSAALVKFQPVANGAGTDAEELGDLFGRASLAQPQQGGEAVVKAKVFVLAA